MQVRFAIGLLFMGMLLLQALSYGAELSCVVLHEFTGGSDGGRPWAGLVESEGYLYGTTGSGGDYGLGCVFRVGRDGRDFSVLKVFAGAPDGARPYGQLLVVGDLIYGTTAGGGAGTNGGGGTIFRMGRDGADFSIIHRFTYGVGGFWPEAGLVHSDGMLYGTTELSAVYPPNYGTVFQVRTNGDAFRVLRILGAEDGANPRANLLLSGTTLFGTTSGHAFPGNGTAFRLSIASGGGDFTVLREFWRGEYGCNRLYSPLVMVGSTLFGTTSQDSGEGTVFRMAADGSGYRELLVLTNMWGVLRGPVMADERFYCTTSGSDPQGPGPGSNLGTVFSVKQDGTGYSLLQRFAGPNGASPIGDFVVLDGGIYGVTSYGGMSNQGVVYALGSPAKILSGPLTQTAETGTEVLLSVVTKGSEPKRYAWFDEATSNVFVGTNASLTLAPVTAVKDLRFRVVVTNLFGASTSACSVSYVTAVPTRTVAGLLVTGQTGEVIEMEAADNVGPETAWTRLGQFEMTTNCCWYFDLSPIGAHKFYRASHLSASDALRLDLSMVTAVTTPTNSGWSLEGINRFGPVDAWFPIASSVVPLTNLPPLYFDVTGVGQPARAYRITPMTGR